MSILSDSDNSTETAKEISGSQTCLLLAWDRVLRFLGLPLPTVN